MQTLLLSFPGILYSTYFSIMNILKREVLIKEEETFVKDLCCIKILIEIVKGKGRCNSCKFIKKILIRSLLISFNLVI